MNDKIQTIIKFIIYLNFILFKLNLKDKNIFYYFNFCFFVKQLIFMKI